MTEQELKAFTRVVTQYFQSVTDIPAQLGVPFVKTDKQEAFDYTGVIGISGSRRGGVYLTASRELLSEFASAILGDDVQDEEALYDMVGEMTNTISGNMREIFGSSFLISVPIIMKGRIDDIVMRLKPPVFIIPIFWNSRQCQLAIGLE
jgi:chemotaxis protein CheX